MAMDEKTKSRIRHRAQHNQEVTKALEWMHEDVLNTTTAFKLVNELSDEQMMQVLNQSEDARRVVRNFASIGFYECVIRLSGRLTGDDAAEGAD